MNADRYIAQALDMGAKNAVPFTPADLAFDTRVALKCIFGCGDYGRNHTCPFQRSPLSFAQYEETLRRYTWGIVIGCADKHISQKISYEIERRAFLDGYYFSFSLSDCGLCPACAKIDDEHCRVPQRARPAFHAVGIDVFKTVRGLGLPLYVMQSENDEANWYSAVFVE